MAPWHWLAIRLLYWLELPHLLQLAHLGRQRLGSQDIQEWRKRAALRHPRQHLETSGEVPVEQRPCPSASQQAAYHCSGLFPKSHVLHTLLDPLSVHAVVRFGKVKEEDAAWGLCGL